jgi:septum formation protein
MNSKLILASKSPRRKQILELAEIDFEIITKDTDESYPLEMPIDEVPIYIAMLKAKDIQVDYPNRKILAADTIVVLDHKIIGKPKDKEDAIQILENLSGKTHKVITGVVILEGEDVIQFSNQTEVSFHQLSLNDIEHYIDAYNPYDKAGSYAIQEWIGAIAIHKINGCFYNVMGLPISSVMTYLKP